VPPGNIPRVVFLAIAGFRRSDALPLAPRSPFGNCAGPASAQRQLLERYVQGTPASATG
jgi:hypothetical protein